jgi:hypothetical protein
MLRFSKVFAPHHPEFWRTAPEAAVDWSAEELDLPPPPRLGEAEEDLVSTGLLRASGLRL